MIGHAQDARNPRAYRRQFARALVDCIDRNHIIEDPPGSGTYRLPTEHEEKRRESIPF